jgi:hypothetical protein
VLAITILKKLTWDVAPSNSRWSPNLLFLRPFKVTSSLNSWNLAGANRVTASSNFQCTSPELCCSRFVPGRRAQSQISHQSPWAITESMKTVVTSRIFTTISEAKKQLNHSSIGRYFYQKEIIQTVKNLRWRVHEVFFFRIEGEHLLNVNCPVQTAINTDRTVCNAIQPVGKCTSAINKKHA